MTPTSSYKPRVLVIDDDEDLNALLADYFGRFGFVTRSAATPEEGLRALKAEAPDIVVLDVMLPGMDGFAVCRKIRETSRLPVVMLTARGDVADRVMGLELGADDYLPKPFEPRELVARIQAVLRRGQSVPENVVRAGDLQIDTDARTAEFRGNRLELTTAEFDLLLLFVRHRGRVLTRERILDETRGLDWEAFDRSIDVLVSRLRHKLGDNPKSPAFIKTVWGRGYAFVGGSGA